MAKKLISELDALTFVDGEFLFVIHDGTSAKSIKISDFLDFVLKQIGQAGGSSNPGSTEPEDPEDGVTTWVDVSDPENPSMKLYLNGEWVDITSPNSGDMMASVYDTKGKAIDIFNYVNTQIATKITGIPEATLTALRNHIADTAIHLTSEKKTAYNAAVTHKNDSAVHVTAADRTKWDAAVTHISNSGMHITAADRTKWNGAVTHISDTDKHVTAEERTKWNAAATHVSQSALHVTAEEKEAWNALASLTDVENAIAAMQNGGAGAGEGAGYHNSIYRGNKLGTSVTAAQWSAIASGDFTDMFIGDYWEIGDVIYRIAAFDYYLHTGGTEVTKHHVTIVPDNCLYTSTKMHSSSTTTQGYQGSTMFTTGLSQAKTTINNAFGAAHVLSHKQYFTNAATNGRASGASEYDSTVDIMNEINVYGCHVYCARGDGSTVPVLYTYDKTQFPLFTYRPDLIMDNKRQWYWLRDVVSGYAFARVVNHGGCGYNIAASSGGGVRPAFSLIGN